MSIVGIDPGQSTGLAVYEKGKLHWLHTVSADRLEQWLAQHPAQLVIFEDSRKTSKTFTAAKGVSAAAALKIARNVGEIDRLCKDIEAMCKRMGIEAYGVAPLAKGSKVNAGDFAQITGWKTRSSQHARDAAMVAWPYRNKASKA
ncbi:hypothetical protein [Comamonas sp. Z1]|uniref:hypothetical protein n=1 Tax=Comamonas sp. Z1 TaxID=2601246 RepID=UPI001CA34177|nr:hypothetical protein [Comamonas sp. Z1]